MSTVVVALSLVTLGLSVLVPPSVSAAACTSVDPQHAAWTAILARRVDAAGLVDYAGLKGDGARDLDAYLANLSGICADDYVKWSRDEKLAFWINAYNAFTVRLVLNHHPIESIRDIGWLPLAAFREKFVPMPSLKGGSISLDDIEHRTIRSDFRDARIHFALVCAARSCPALRREAYRGSDLDRQLEDQGRVFLGDPTKNRVEGGVAYLSSIFKWFQGDFEAPAGSGGARSSAESSSGPGVAGGSGSLWAFVAPYLGKAPEPEPRIEFLGYDWRLNEQAKR